MLSQDPRPAGHPVPRRESREGEEGRCDIGQHAIREGHAFADTVFGKRPVQVDHATIPTAVFSQPEVGTVGLTEAEARAQFSRVDIYKTDFRPIKATMSGRDTRVLMKLVVDGLSDRVLGCHIVGDCAAVLTALASAVERPADQRAAWLERLRQAESAWWDSHRAEVESDADEPAVPGWGGGLGPRFVLEQVPIRTQDSSSSALPGSAATASNPAASAASGVANHTSAIVAS